MILTKKDLENILDGAAFLGSGGGGSLLAGETFLKLIIGDDQSGTVELISFSDAEKIGMEYGCVICDIGATSKFDENQASALEFAFDSLRKEFASLGDIKYLFPIEIGPENTFAPLVLAAKRNLKVVDADGAGRAVPTIPLSTFYLEKPANFSPVCIANGKGNVMKVYANTIEEYEKLLRGISGLDLFNESASLALWPDTVNKLNKNGMHGAITRCLNFGHFFRSLREKNKMEADKQLDFINKFSGYLIGSGKVLDFDTDNKGGFTFTTARVKCLTKNEELTLISKNETLIAYSTLHSHPKSLAPDSICFLDENFKAFTNSELVEKKAANSTIHIIGIEANKQLKGGKLFKGFEDVLNDRGYFGHMDFKRGKTMKLGLLLNALYMNDYSYLSK